MHTRFIKANRTRGFTLLLAALTASIALAIGSAIFDIAQKQLFLSALSRDSQFSFYAADTGVECALYWDIRYDYFAATTPAGVSPTCDAQPFSIGPLNNQAYPYRVTFQFDYASAFCVTVEVAKCDGDFTGTSIDDPGETCSGGGQSIHTWIRSDGFSNKCAYIGSGTDLGILQRSIEVHY